MPRPTSTNRDAAHEESHRQTRRVLDAHSTALAGIAWDPDNAARLAAAMSQISDSITVMSDTMRAILDHLHADHH